MSQRRVGQCPVESASLLNYLLRIADKRGVLADGVDGYAKALVPYLPSNYLPDIHLAYPLLGEEEPFAAMMLNTYDYHAIDYASDGTWQEETCKSCIPAPRSRSDIVGLVASKQGIRPFSRDDRAWNVDENNERGKDLCSNAPADCVETIDCLRGLGMQLSARHVDESFVLSASLPRAGMQHTFANNSRREDILAFLRHLGVSEQRLAGLTRASGRFGVPYYEAEYGYCEHVVLLDLSHLELVWKDGQLTKASAVIVLSDKIIGYAGMSLKVAITYQWHITDECDQRCKHCYLFAEDARAACVTTPWEQLMHTLDQVQEHNARIHAYPRFAITGGDPILHPRFWDLAQEFQRRGIPWIIMGNPFHLNAEVCRRLRELGCIRYQMSLDGLEEFHDYLRKPGSYRATLAALKLLREAGVQTQLMATASNQNLDDIIACMDIAVQHGVSSFGFARYCATSPDKAQELYPTPEQYRDFLLAYWNKKQAYERAGCKTSFKLKEHLFTLLRWELGEFEVPEWAKERTAVCEGCHLGAKATICANGDLLACRRMPSVVGNIRTDNLWDVEKSDAMQRYAQVEGIRGCNTCELLYWCRGCRAVGVNATGDLMAADPMCWKAKSEDA